VVTGLRFVKKNRVIHLQIQEGKLLPRMIINATTLNWKEPEDYKIDDGKMFDGQDYHTLTWKNRKMDLDDLEADDGYVLTGMKSCFKVLVHWILLYRKLYKETQIKLICV